MRYHVFTRHEIVDHFGKTGQWLNQYHNIIPDVDRCINSDPKWLQAKRDSTFLERHGWEMQRHYLRNYLTVWFAMPDMTRPRLMELLAVRRWGIIFNPTWTPFDADDLPRCPACNALLPQYEFGRPAKYCNDACKMKAYRQRRVTKV